MSDFIFTAPGGVAPPGEPFARFRALLDAAVACDRARLPEPTAFALATVGEDGAPSVRILLLKRVDAGGFVFFTNYESRKGRELLRNRQAAMCFHWQPFELQVRIEGRVEPVSGDEADAYFASRPRGSQLGAWASQQSRLMRDPSELHDRLDEVAARFEGGVVPRPPYWSGFRLRPRRIEFWRGMPSRLHERHRYVRAEGHEEWTVELLYP